MKILFVSAVFPYPLYSGGQVRIYNLLKALGSKHAISLFAFTRKKEEQDLASMLPFCKKIVPVLRGRAWRIDYIFRAIAGNYPWVFATYDNAAMRDAIAQELAKEQYDLIHIEPGYVWPSLPKTTVPIVVGEHNVEHHIYEGYVRQFPVPFFRPFLSTDVTKMKAWEKKVWQHASAITTVSNDDRKEITLEVSEKNVQTVANGVDVKEFEFRPKLIKTSAPVVLFVGNFLWMQNRDALRYLLTDIWGKVQELYPQAKLRVVGRHLPQAARNQVSRMGGELLEHVEDIQNEFHAADVLFAPIRVGGGTKFKILEAMASGIPVITTTIGAGGLAVEHSRELMIADTPDETTEALTKVLQNTEDTLRMVKRARACIEKKYSWQMIATELDQVWKDACGKH